MVRDGLGGKAVGIEHIQELSDKGIAAAKQIPFAQQMLRDGSLEYVTVLPSILP